MKIIDLKEKKEYNFTRTKAFIDYGLLAINGCPFIF